MAFVVLCSFAIERSRTLCCLVLFCFKFSETVIREVTCFPSSYTHSLMRMSSCLKEMPKLILMQCLFALWLPATATYPSMVSLFDEVAEELEQFQADYSANVKDSIGNEIGSFEALTGGMSLPVAGRRISGE